MKGMDMVAELAQLGLDKVRINKDKLVAKLKENRSKHKEEFIAALQGWKTIVLVTLKKNLTLAEKDEEWHLSVSEEKPQDHTKDYDHVISLLEASVDDIVVISAQEFRQYHDDEWRWKGVHTEAFSNYSGAARR